LRGGVSAVLASQPSLSVIHALCLVHWAITGRECCARPEELWRGLGSSRPPYTIPARELGYSALPYLPSPLRMDT